MLDLLGEGELIMAWQGVCYSWGSVPGRRWKLLMGKSGRELRRLIVFPVQRSKFQVPRFEGNILISTWEIQKWNGKYNDQRNPN